MHSRKTLQYENRTGPGGHHWLAGRVARERGQPGVGLERLGLDDDERTPEHRTPTANNYSEQLQRTTTANNYSALVQTPERGRRTKSGPALNNVWVLWARVAFDLLLRVGVYSIHAPTTHLPNHPIWPPRAPKPRLRKVMTPYQSLWIILHTHS